MDSTKPIATKDGYSALRKSDLAQLAKELGLFESSGELASFLSEYAQLVEHWSPKPGVGSSSLSIRANNIIKN